MKTHLTGIHDTSHSVSSNPLSHAVVAVREHAMEIATMRRSANGWAMLFQLILLGILCAAALLLPVLFVDLLRGGGNGPLVALLVLPFLVLAWIGAIQAGIGLWLDNFGRPLDLPQLYNRSSGRVHLLEESPQSDFKWKNLKDILDAEARRRWFGPRPVTVRTFAWASLVAEEYSISETVVGGATIHRRRLALVSQEKPADDMAPLTDDVSARFNVGESGAYLGPSTMPEEWEHVRRYMRHEGPALATWDTRARRTGKASWWCHLGECSAFGPGYTRFWREHPVLATLVHALLPLTMPLALLVASLSWLSERTAYQVAWPEEVLRDAGPLIEARRGG